MPRNYFTEEQIKELQENQYVVKVTRANVSFAIEFKQKLYSLLLDGVTPKEALIFLGINPSILGRSRIGKLAYRIRNESKRPEGFNRKKGTGMGRIKKPTFNSLEEENRYLKDQLEYQRQEIEFLKKLEALEQKYPKSQRKKSSK